ncbi:hypothetical protein SAMN05443572_104628 [Myxococcus fulvus]|uniref:DUF1579 domain-containing protein n=1 Tax=Myxococcus fulvus TaxID=33 RepID=A0A511SXX1_MYXFU|nr:hypothetical protein [Myxococcus fulvus]GEN06741.1 hypothetical protein MFU01_17780 [Myxococcus fulvus]SEU05644.1 hypothetical protein SAMN05443572_104628 [Myxococcus fulvus]
MRSQPESPLSQRALELLRADGPLPALAESLSLFGRFIGAWDVDVAFFDATGKQTYRQPGEWSFSWVLDGRVIQDVLIYPNPEGLGASVGARRIGTSLRQFIPEQGTWRVVWMGATAGYLVSLVGRPVGDEIHIEGKDPDGKPLRWMFTAVTDDSFLWRGFMSEDGGSTYRLTQEMHARRGVHCT